MAELEAIPIPGTKGAEQPFFSPDGQAIGFYDRRAGSLRQLPLSGGPPVTLCDLTDTGFRGASWGENNVIFFGSGIGLREVSAAGGMSRPVTSLDVDRGERNHRNPHVLPGGRGVLFEAEGFSSSISIVLLSTGERRVLVEGSGNPRFASSGHLVFPREGLLMAVPFDLERLETVGSPVVVLEGVASLARPALFDLADDGTLAYVPGPIQTRLADTLVRIDREGVAESLAATSKRYRFPRVSHDGRRISFHTASVRGERPNIWSLELARGTLTRLTFGGSDLSPIWSPDGTFYCNCLPLWVDQGDGGCCRERPRIDIECLVRRDGVWRMRPGGVARYASRQRGTLTPAPRRPARNHGPEVSWTRPALPASSPSHRQVRTGLWYDTPQILLAAWASTKCSGRAPSKLDSC